MRQTVSLLIVMAMVQPVAAQTSIALLPGILAKLTGNLITALAFEPERYTSLAQFYKGKAEQPLYLSSLNLVVRPPEHIATTSVVSVGLPGTRITYRFNSTPMVWIHPESKEKASFSWSEDGRSFIVERLLSEHSPGKSTSRVEFEYSGCLLNVYTDDDFQHLFTRYNNINPELFDYLAYPAYVKVAGDHRSGVRNRALLRLESISGCSTPSTSQDAPFDSTSPLHPDYKPSQKSKLAPLATNPKEKKNPSDQPPKALNKYQPLPPIKKEENKDIQS
ncbi:hypothetical protein [Endozoicomonas sp. 4G]|uniref:hypothetical protein n=1 Tax=Endozoicomonas sp. 4G TaxID=2872754 RepID=UPI002078861A|nr:hypothetical protein [Endozoicomonas sp. 4G]